MSREELLKRFDKKATRDNYIKAFNKFDEFLLKKNQTELDFIQELNKIEPFQRYEILQQFVFSLKESVSPISCRDYFGRIFKYLLLEGVQLDYTQKRIRIRLPRIINKIFEGLDKENILKLISFSSNNFGCYMKTLAGSGMRETEGLLLKPNMIMWDEFPLRIKLPGEITKFSIPRETFLPGKTGDELKKLIEEKQVGENETIFIKEWSERSLEDFEKYFNVIRAKAGLETPNRIKHQQNDITLHSLRSYFITTFTDHNQNDFGHALAGHSKYFSIYYRHSLKERQTSYAEIMPYLEF